MIILTISENTHIYIKTAKILTDSVNGYIIISALRVN